MSEPVRIVYHRILKRRTVPMPRLRIAIMADLHACTPHMDLPRVRSLVAQVNALQPDLICLLGDYAGHGWGTSPVPVDSVVQELTALQAPLGVFAVFGNHDWKDDPKARETKASSTHWHRAFERFGLVALNNEARVLETSQGPMTLAGLDSQRAYFSRFPKSRGGADDLNAILPHMPEERFTLLLAHEPDIFPSLPSHVDLTFSGHVHGGQINPFGKPLLVPSIYGTRYAYGHHMEDTRQLVVSAGLGVSGIPIRMNMPPELNLVELA